ncbi:polysaccharide biosynthesis protein [groundwater metagenome]
MLNSLKKYYHEPLYRNSIAMMLNSAFAAFFGLLFWIVTARTISAKGAWDSGEVGQLD